MNGTGDGANAASGTAGNLSLVVRMPAAPTSVADVDAGLRSAGYLPGESTALVSFLAARLGKPVLVEGPAGVGKTELAKALATYLDRTLVRLQCYEGLDEAKALYEWNYRKQLLRIQAEAAGTGWDAVQDDIFGEEFLLARPLMTRDRRRGAGRAPDRRDRQDRPGVRGDAARAAVGLPDHDPGAGPDRGPHAPGRAAHLEQLARADRGAQAPLPVPLARLPERGARARDRAHAHARAARRRRREARRGHRPRARPRPQEAAVDRGVDRLGAGPAPARRRGHRRGRVPVHDEHHRQAPDGPRRRGGARRGAARPRARARRDPPSASSSTSRRPCGPRVSPSGRRSCSTRSRRSTPSRGPTAARSARRSPPRWPSRTTTAASSTSSSTASSSAPPRRRR